MGTPLAGEVIATILRHDTRLTSYKLALVRAVNDAALAFRPHLTQFRAR
jgi:hypothetical protein